MTLCAAEGLCSKGFMVSVVPLVPFVVKSPLQCSRMKFTTMGAKGATKWGTFDSRGTLDRTFGRVLITDAKEGGRTRNRENRGSR
jgi:hypothetical protein